MKVSICFIGTGKYLNFLPKYYENIHEYFLPNSEKEFLVFTDGEGDFPEDIKVYHVISDLQKEMFLVKT